MTQAGMISGYGDKEREFLDALETDTGRSLAQWMDAIRAQGLSQRNDIIDWLRQQGFRFSRASWLERVHHNGGQPIYAGRPAAVRPPPRAPQRDAKPSSPRQAALGSSPLPPPPRPATPVPAQPAKPRPAADAYALPAATAIGAGHSDPLAADITALTAKAKAYRPLADFLLREIAKTVPGATFAPRGQHIAIASGNREFATLAISARDLKLSLLPVSGTASSVPLTDARQVDAPLLDRIRQASRHPG